MTRCGLAARDATRLRRRNWRFCESRCGRVRRRSSGMQKRYLPSRRRPRDGRDRPSVLRKRGTASSAMANSRRAQPLDGASTVPGGEDDKFVNYWSVWFQSQVKIVQRTPTWCNAVSFLGITLSGQLRIGVKGAPAAARNQEVPARSAAAMQATPRAPRLERVAASEPWTSMPRQASSITTTAKPSRTASSAE